MMIFGILQQELKEIVLTVLTLYLPYFLDRHIEVRGVTWAQHYQLLAHPNRSPIILINLQYYRMIRLNLNLFAMIGSFFVPAGMLIWRWASLM